MIYVSWNGDTETDVWRFYVVSDEYGSRSLLGKRKRTSFETSLHVPHRELGAVLAEAVDEFGSILRSTAAARTELQILPIAAAEEVPPPKISRIQRSVSSSKAGSLREQFVLLLFGGRWDGPGGGATSKLTHRLITFRREWKGGECAATWKPL